MKKIIIAGFCISIFLLVIACKENKQQAEAKEIVNIALFDKELPVIKESVNGKWELISGQNSRELNEFENTFIEFDGDNYIWTENGESEKGALNWRKAETGSGYDAYLMDAFYAEYPSYPVALKGDTLYIQDCTKTAYKYKLVRKR